MHLQKIKVKVSKNIKKLVDEKKAISLDIGCGAYKRTGAIGMDIRPMEGVDIVHDFNQFPWPLPNDSCSLITANHVMEHIPKWGASPQIHALAKLLVKNGVLSQKDIDGEIGETQIFSYFMRFMDEAWRIMKVGGQFAMVMPYAGSIGFHQDPTHAAPITEALWFYFDPEHSSNLWHIYKPLPWKIDLNTFQVNGNIEVILSKREMTKEYEESKFI